MFAVKKYICLIRGNIKYSYDNKYKCIVIKFRGREIRYRRNGNILCDCKWKNGKRHGLYKGYYANGNIWFEENYLKNKQHGLHRAWNKDGHILYEHNYLYNKPHGWYIGYNEDGTIRYKEYYKNGKISEN